MPARRAAVALLLLAGCNDIDTAATTSPTAHESPGLDAPVEIGPLERIAGGRYLGGAGLDLADDVAVGADGTVYVVGGTASPDFPVTVGSALDPSTPAGCTTCPFDGFVAAIDPTGAALWVRLIQSSGYDRMSSVVVHGDRVWVGGTSDGGGIICQLDRATGQGLLCHDAGGERGVSDLAMPPDGSELVAAMIVVAGEELHLDPAYVEAFAGAHRGTSTSDDGLLLGLSPDFSEPNPRRWATYVGGSGVEGGTPSVVRDDLFTIYLGESSSDDAPAPDGFATTRNLGADAYLAAFSDGGTTLRYGTYAGGAGDERVSPNSLFGDRFELYVGLTTTSEDMPAGAVVVQPGFGGNGGPGCGEGDVWLARVQLGNLVGAATLRVSRYFGSGEGERFGGFARAITASAAARVVMVMQTHSLLVTIRAAQWSLAGQSCHVTPGNADAYVATLSAVLSVSDATYVGGSAGDGALAVAQHIGGPILTIGNTESADLAVPGLFDNTYGGDGDGFLMAHLGDPFVPPQTDGGCGFCPDGGGFDSGFPGNGDAAIPPGYDESAGCCGASTQPTGSLALALATLALLVLRRRTIVRLLLIAASLGGCADMDIDTGVTTSPTAHESLPLPPPPLERIGAGRFLGGGGLDVVDDLAMGSGRIMFVVGGTASLDFPVTTGETLDASTPADCPACPFDGFVAALDRDGAARWIRLIQSPGYDRLTAVAASGDSVWVAGSTGDRGDGPGFNGGVDPERGAQDGILCELAASDGAVRGCRYVGGSGASGVSDLDLSKSGTEIVVAMTVTAAEALHLDPAYSAAFAGAHRATSDSDDGLVLGFGADLTQPDALRWATYVGGSGAERGTPSVMRDDTFIYYLGETASDDAPIAQGAQPTRGGGTDAYLAVIDGANQSLRYATYLGGSGDERVDSNALFGNSSELYLGLTTTSNDMPEGDGSADGSFAGNGGPGCGDGDIWLARLQLGNLPGPETLRATRYLGGPQGERFGGISQAVTFFGNGRVLITGQTYSSNFPTTLAAQPGLAGSSCTIAPGNSDAFVAILSPDFFISDASYLGATAADRGVAAVMGFDFPVMVAGVTESAGFPAPGPFDTTYGGGGDGFLTAFHLRPDPPFPGDGGGPIDEDAGGIPPDYDESAGCCGAAGSPTGSLGLGFATLLMVLFRRRRPR